MAHLLWADFDFLTFLSENSSHFSQKLSAFLRFVIPLPN